MDRLHAQQMEFELVGRQRPFHARVEEVELRGAVVGDARGADLARALQLVQAARGVGSGRQPVGTVHEEELDVVRAEQPQ